MKVLLDVTGEVERKAVSVVLRSRDIDSNRVV